jgi:hypothetical protein
VKSGGRVNPVSRVFTTQSILVFLDTYEAEEKEGRHPDFSGELE